MGFAIEDGTGSGRNAKVTVDNRLATEAVIVFPIEEFSHKGDVFLVSTDFISLTITASYSGILYLQNNNTTHRIHIAALRQSSTVDSQWRVIKNPTTGTLISGASVITPQNLRFDSGKTAQMTAYKGVDAATITNGSLVGQYQTPAYTTLPLDIEGGIILNYGNSIAIEAKPSAACQVGVTVTCWFEPID